MATAVLMPALSPTMTEGKLAKWLVNVGDKVSSGDVIAEIETDKATMEVEATDDGIIGKIIISDGTDSVAVGTQIAFILDEGEDISAINLTTTPAMTISSQTPAAPVAANNPPQTTATIGSSEHRIKASPLARRIAVQNNIDLKNVTATGTNNRIVKSDIDAMIARGGQNNTQQTKQSAPQTPQNIIGGGMSDAEILATYNADDYELVPVDGMRKIIAKRLLESKTTIPHFYVSADIELDALLKLRTQLNNRSPEGAGAYKLSVNDFVIKAVAMALQQIPDANVTWTTAGMLKHKYSDVGVAVSVEGGLFTPVIRRAEQKSLVVISNEMKDLAKRARSRKLMPQEYQGGTTAVSNLGMFGVKNFSAIVNPPHASIFAIGAGEQRAVVRDGALAIATVMSATLSVDHRAVDGALGAELLQAFKKLIEDPMGLLL